MSVRSWLNTRQHGRVLIDAQAGAEQKKRRDQRGVFFPARGPEKPVEVTYFETDFLNMRSIFSFVASTPDWAA